MRDINRIDRITNKINELWKEHSEQRLMQLLINYVLPRIDNDSRLFYFEDTLLEEKIDYITKLLGRESKKNE